MKWKRGKKAQQEARLAAQQQLKLQKQQQQQQAAFGARSSSGASSMLGQHHRLATSTSSVLAAQTQLQLAMAAAAGQQQQQATNGNGELIRLLPTSVPTTAPMNGTHPDSSVGHQSQPGELNPTNEMDAQEKADQFSPKQTRSSADSGSSSLSGGDEFGQQTRLPSPEMSEDDEREADEESNCSEIELETQERRELQ